MSILRTSRDIRNDIMEFIMSGKAIKESNIDTRDANWRKANNLLKADEETVTRVLKDGLVVADDSTPIYPTTIINKILTNSVYGMTIFTDKPMPSVVSTKPEVSSVRTEIETKVETLLNEVTLLKSRVDELEQENELLRSRVDKANVENEELRYRDGVLERHISELKLKFML